MADPPPPTIRRSRSITSLLRRQESCGPTVLSILVSSYQVRWRTVEERLATHPVEATILDSNGRSVLFHAIARDVYDYPPFPIIRSILRAYPQAIWDRHQFSTILEHACAHMASLETLELLCQARPAISEDSSALSTLWKAYCQHYDGEEEFVRVLRCSRPNAYDIGCKFQLLLRYLTTERLLPCTIHTAAASSNCSLYLFQRFCELFPEQSEDRLPDGSTVLHCALVGAHDQAHQADKALFLARTLGGLLVDKDAGGRLPLHLALQEGIVTEENVKYWVGGDRPSNTRGRNSSLVSMLRDTLYDCDDPHSSHMEIEPCPPSEKNKMVQNVREARDPATRLFPFQAAAASQASVSTIFELLRPVPHLLSSIGSIRRPLRQKSLAILSHIHSDWISPNLTQLLTAVEPSQWDELHETLRCPVDPLWHQLIGGASVIGCPVELLRILIDMHPEKLLHADQQGWLPLHHAVAARHGENEEIVRLLLDACPEATCFRDKQGLLPFHLAILQGKEAWLLELLLRVQPDAMSQPEYNSGLPPALLAAQSSLSSVSAIFFLLSSSPDVVQGGVVGGLRKKRRVS